MAEWILILLKVSIVFPHNALEDAHATGQLHCHCCSGPCQAKRAASAASVSQCYAPEIDKLAAVQHSISCSQSD